jgi:hypothetical protein
MWLWNQTTFSVFLMFLLILEKNRNQLKTKYFFANLEMSVSSKRNFYIDVVFWGFITGIKIRIIQMLEFMSNSELKDMCNQSQIKCVIIRISVILFFIALERNEWPFLPLLVIPGFTSLFMSSFYVYVNQILSLAEPSEINILVTIPSSNNFVISDALFGKASIVCKW